MYWFNPLFNICTGITAQSKLTEKQLASYKNNVAFQNVFATKIQDALERYDIKGLPDTLSKRALLQSFLWNAGACIFEKEGNLFGLPCAPDSGVNIYGDTDHVWAFGLNGFNERVKVFIPGGDEASFLKTMTGGVEATGEAHGVYIWENRIRFPFINQVMFYSEAIADTMRTLDVVKDNIKNPYIITAEESVVPTVKEFYKKRSNNERFVIDTGIFPVDKINVINLNTQGTQLTDCVELIEWYENKLRELNGVDSNSQIDKKGENLISDEVHVNDVYEALQVEKCIECMQEGFDLVNKFFGTNITVQKKERDVKDGTDKDIPGDKNDATGDGSLPG